MFSQEHEQIWFNKKAELIEITKPAYEMKLKTVAKIQK